MATRCAGAAIFSLLEVDGEHPAAVAVRHGLADVERLLGRVHLMAGSARSAVLSVDMDEVQVLVPLAEAGQAGPSLVEHEVWLVA